MKDNKLKNLLKYIRRHKLLTFLYVFGTVSFVYFVLVILGYRDCSDVHIKEGVKQTCDCKGLEVEVRSTTINAEQQTVCIGIISNRTKYK